MKNCFKALLTILMLFTGFVNAQSPPQRTVKENKVLPTNDKFIKSSFPTRTIDMDSVRRIKVTPQEINDFIAARPAYTDTAGRFAELTEIILNAKKGLYFGMDSTYTTALTRSEKFYNLRHQVDKVLVVKHERKMYLQKKGITIKTFNIALGPNPVGQKEYEGDGKTPEGIYTLDWTKWVGANFSSYHISYPNEADIARAKQKGLTPGSNIMVHGTNGVKKQKDWTNGCIALSNADLNRFKEMVFQDTVIEIVK